MNTKDLVPVFPAKSMGSPPNSSMLTIYGNS